ncbi:fructose 1,6-bisphosphatase [Candidatus Viadribacter manganicus]|uniref:Fructose-1,6-bisphosphatase n=2 Tax=Candidatus Viadribacter manganicus TaxID=1759059 RepID=A0A1B1ADG3_9PROT|nr:class II fructose-bisphosphatase [Candidatus Viadribacter manganicus]ANP44598.1 fructose 1,6-bisphosphatase [Candidatus Viadribacter manganicus]
MSDIITDELALAIARAPINAAIAAAKLVGRGDERAADQAAVDAMRAALNALAIRGRVVIGEGERDDAPMLFVGESVGGGKGPELDIALDPLEGTTLAAKAKPNALSVIAVAPKGGLLHAPDTYMDKIAIGPGFPDGVIDLDEDAAQNVKALAKAKGVTTSEIGVCVLDRPRHGAIIESLRGSGAKVFLIGDGDIAGVIHCTKPETGIDMYLGSGGAPEGVLAAAALKCVGGQFQGRLVIRNDQERVRAQQAGIEELKRRYDLNDLVSGAAVFIATGVTSGSLLEGVRIRKGEVQTHTLVLNCASGASMELKTRERAQ